ncbi:MAG: hypothetical protein R3A44_22410 [Caldilineaceae bacterium]
MADYFATVLEHAQGIVGWDTIYMHMLAEPHLAKHFFERLTHELVTGITLSGRRGRIYRCLYGGRRCGPSAAPMMKMDVYKEFVFPGHKAIFQAIHDHSNAAVFSTPTAQCRPCCPS